MFDKDFYPTPINVINYMIGGLDLENKNVLEPSAGSGNILDVLNSFGANTFACELNDKLSLIAERKCDSFLGNDFIKLTREDVSHIEFIVMNPPFSNGDKHIKHAWDIAPDGCQIVSLCNWETLNNRFSRSRNELYKIIKDYGFCEDIGSMFVNSERSTNVSIGLVRLNKPTSDKFDFSDYFTNESDDIEVQENGIMEANAVREVVQRYVGAVKLFENVAENAISMNYLVGQFNIKDLAFTLTKEGKEQSIERFKIDLQKVAWDWIFSKMNLEKYMTSKLKEEIAKFVEMQKSIPFTMKNIYKMFDMVYQTNSQRMERVYVEIFDKITMHHDKNRYSVNGWKTNSHKLVKQKFILEDVFRIDWSGNTISPEYGWRNVELFTDLIKAMDYLEGTDFFNLKTDNKIGWRSHLQNIQPNEWYDYGHFEIKAFKKGTMHVKFKDKDVWHRFNKVVAKSKGFELPEKI